MRQTNRKKRKPTGQKGQNVIIIYKVGKGCVLNEGRKVITEVVKDSHKSSFITEVYFLFF